MAKAGDWGGNPAAIKGSVKRTKNVTPNATVTRAEAKPIQGEAPKLKLYSDPWYDRAPFDPEFRRLQAKGSDDVEHGQ
jgi:hypothetical protein